MAARSLLAAVAAAAALSVAHGIVTGIDFGHEFMKVSLVKPGQSFQIASNVESKRKTPAMMAFYQEERLFGGHADSLRGRKPRNVVAEPHVLLGRNASHPAVARYVNASHYIVTTGANDRGGVDVVLPEGSLIPAAGSPAILSAEELTAQLLAHAKDFTEAFAGAGVRVRDAVITVPAYATQGERLALLDAAELAGYNVLALADENTAAGVHYGIDRVHGENGTAPHLMLLYNMGASATQVTLFQYDSYVAWDKAARANRTVGQGRVLAKAWDIGLGGRAFDEALIQHAAAAFNADPKASKKLPKDANGDIRNNAGAMVKIAKAIVKAKEILSANEEYQLFLEGVLPDVDFRVTLSRAVLDAAAAKAGLWGRVTAVVEDVLAQANVTAAAINAVELVGGGVRMPKVAALIKDFFPMAPPAPATVNGTPAAPAFSIVGTHMNGDECFALGAAFAAANRSAAFRVRPVGMVDAFPWAIGVRVSHLAPSAAAANATATATPAAAASEAASDDSGAAGAAAPGKPWSKRSSLFRAYHALDTPAKRIAFTSDRDLRVALSYEATATGGATPALPPGTPKTIGFYNVTGLEALLANATIAARGPAKVQLSFVLDASGLARLVKAEALQEEEVLVPELPTPRPTPSATAPAAGVNGTNATAANATAANATAAAEDASASATATATVSATAEPTAEAEDADEAEASASKATVTASNGTAAGNATNATGTAGGRRMRAVKRTHRYPLTVTLDTGALPVSPLGASHKAAIHARLAALRKADDAKRALEAAKNELEAYIYRVRDRRDAAEGEEDPAGKAKDLYAAVTTEAQREAIVAAMAAEDDWINEEGGDADLEAFQAHLATLKAVVEPVFARAAEAKARPDAVAAAQKVVTALAKTVTGWNTTHPQITANETADAAKAVAALSEWLEDTVAAQAELAGSEEPVLTRAAIDAKLGPVKTLVTRLDRKPRPTPTPTAKPAKAPKAAGNATNSSAGAAAEEGEEDDADATFTAGSGSADEQVDANATASSASASASPSASASATAAAAAEDKVTGDASSSASSAAAAGGNNKKKGSAGTKSEL